MIITNNSKVYKNLTKIKNHGQKNLYDHEINGVNSRLDSLNAYVLSMKLDIFDDIASSRVNLYNYFNKNIDNPYLTKPFFKDEEVPNYYSILVKKGRNKFIEYLNSNGISTNIYCKNQFIFRVQ